MHFYTPVFLNPNAVQGTFSTAYAMKTLCSTP